MDKDPKVTPEGFTDETIENLSDNKGGDEDE